MEDSADPRSGHRFVDAASTLHDLRTHGSGAHSTASGETWACPLRTPPDADHRRSGPLLRTDRGAARVLLGPRHRWPSRCARRHAVPASLSAGHFHTCGITAEGLTTCWGRTTEGQSTPPATTTFTQLSAGWAHTCGLTASGEAVCWGCENRHRDLQIGDTDACSPPSSTFPAIAAGDLWQSCGLTPDGEVQCWGGIDRQGVWR